MLNYLEANHVARCSPEVNANTTPRSSCFHTIAYYPPVLSATAMYIMCFWGNYNNLVYRRPNHRLRQSHKAIVLF